MKRLKTILYISIVMLCLSACDKAINENTAQPADSLGKEYDMHSESISQKTITLYYPDLALKNLLRIVNEVNIFERSSEVWVITNRLLMHTPQEDANYTVPFNNKIGVDWIKVSRNLAKINLNGDFNQFTEKEFFCGIISIVNTVCQINQIDFVEILINGQQFKNRGLLVNPMSTMDTSLHLIYLDHINIIQLDNRDYDRDKIILYYLDTNSNFLIAEVSNTTVSEEGFVGDLFRLLKNEPNYGSGIQSCIPQNMLMTSEATISNENGINILTLRLESPKYETMDNKTRYMLCGSLTLTLLGYIQDVSAIKIFINGQPALEETILYEEMFIDTIGQIVTVYLPNRDLEYLVKVDIAMSQQRYNNPKERLNEIILAENNYKNNTFSVIPDNVDESDILDVFVHESCCVINISNNLYTKLYNSNYKIQKMFLYSIVNSMTEFENISSVQLIVEGKIEEKLRETLYIETPILSNPGLVYE